MNFMLCAVVVVVIVAVVAYYVAKPKAEGYNATSFSMNSGLQRTPVTFAFRDNGMNNNPRYWAAPTDKPIPLEYGGQDFYQRPVSKVLNPPLLNNSVNFVEDEHLGAPHHQPGMLGEYKYAPNTLVNDSKLRLDMVTSGEVGVHRVLNNMFDETHAFIPGDYTFDAEGAMPEQHQPLYAEWYHTAEILGH